MKVFLLSSSYMENLIVANLEHLINCNIKEIVMLKENHSITEYENYKKNAITLCDTAIEAAMISDMAIIITPYNSSDYRYMLIYEKIKPMLPKAYYINLNDYSSYNVLPPKESCLEDVPIILILTVGQFHQATNLELSLSELLIEKQVKYSQFYSPLSAMILAGFKTNKILNPKIIKSMYTSAFDVKLVTLGADSIESLFNDMSLLQIVDKLNPDYVFLIREKEWEDSRDDLSILQNRLNCRFDSVLHSDYITILWDEIKTPILSTNYFETYIDSAKKERLWDDIVKKMTYPESIKVI